MAAILVTLSAGPQNAPETLKFEVASIKRAEPGARTSFELSPSGAVTAVMDVKFLLQMALQKHDYQIAGMPKWLESEYYRIVAKPPEGSLLDQRNKAAETSERLRSLLVERFQLQFHKEMREMPVFSLVVAKNGPKLHSVPENPDFKLRLGKGKLVAPGGTMDLLATHIANHFSRVVINNTGLRGYYDIILEYSTDDAQTDGRPSLLTALQEQLGLRLEATKAPVEILVIDRIERPSEN